MKSNSLVYDKMYKYLEEASGKIPDTVDDPFDIKMVGGVFICNGTSHVPRNETK